MRSRPLPLFYERVYVLQRQQSYSVLMDCATMYHDAVREAMRITYDKENLDKREVTRDEVDEVLANEPKDEDIEPSVRGNVRVMFGGFTFQGRMLEIGIEYFPDDREHVFHAMDATKVYRTLFNKRKR